MKKALLIAIIAATISTPSKAQAPFTTMDSLDINKINAKILVHGDMWWNPVTELAAFQFPKGTPTQANFAGALWMSGYDGGNQLHVAAQTYRQDGNDYWPGPLDASDTLILSTATNWAKIWKVNRTEIDAFTLLTSHTIANTPSAILTWPAKGNVNAQGNLAAPLNITTDMAPFVDLNGNGIYEPLLGEYPDVPGDQALWWVFSDNGPTHTESHGAPLGVEVQCLAYAYARGTLMDNVQYYAYTIINKSGNDYHNFRLALRDDIDLGYYEDDYIGFDSTWRLGYAYNGTSNDGAYVGHPQNSYGTRIPISGVTLVDLPGDAGTSYAPTGSFMTYNNDFSFSAPTVDTQFDNLMRGKYVSGEHFTDDFPGGPPCGVDSTTNPNYIFTGDPSVPGQWSECACNNTPGDRRFVLATNDFPLNAGTKQRVVMAAVVTDPDTLHSCPHVGNFNDIKVLADTAWAVYHHPPPVLPAGINNISAHSGIKVYPNPADDLLTVELTDDRPVTMNIYNAIGQELPITVSQKNNTCKLDIEKLPSGVYLLRVKDGDEVKTATFVKR